VGLLAPAPLPQIQKTQWGLFFNWKYYEYFYCYFQNTNAKMFMDVQCPDEANFAANLSNAFRMGHGQQWLLRGVGCIA
jgi:hypothetical protein